MKKLIYLIEDDVDILNMMCTLLLKNGFDVHADWNGNDLDNKTNPGPIPDIYLMDVNLYGKSGLDLCKSVKERLPDKPVMLISANHNFGEKALSAGADAFIEKPFDLNQLVQQINKLTDNQSALPELL